MKLKKILERSTDFSITKRRIKMIIISALILIIVVLYLSFRISSKTIGVVFAIYVIITAFEKVGYGNAVLNYKSIIQKLVNRIKELENKNTI